MYRTSTVPLLSQECGAYYAIAFMVISDSTSIWYTQIKELKISIKIYRLADWLIWRFISVLFILAAPNTSYVSLNKYLFIRCGDRTVVFDEITFNIDQLDLRSYKCMHKRLRTKTHWKGANSSFRIEFSGLVNGKIWLKLAYNCLQHPFSLIIYLSTNYWMYWFRMLR